MEKLTKAERAGIELLGRPEYCPGAYSLHLYCRYRNPAHAYNEFPHEPDQCQTYAQAARVARAWGWTLHRDGTATCPKCNAALSGAGRALLQHDGEG